MRASTILIAALGLSSSGLFAQTVIDFTPATLADPAWTLTGVSPASLTVGAGGWILPANGQISRVLSATESASNVAVTLTARPLFTVQGQQGPVLELGPEDLVFLRTDSGGRLVLLSGAGATNTLPALVPLDSTGVSTAAFTVQLGYDAASQTYSASALGGTINVPTATGTAGPADVALSSGPGAALQVSDFALTVTPNSPAGTSTASASTAGGSSGPSPVQSAMTDLSWLQSQINSAVRQSIAGNYASAWAALQATEAKGAFAAIPTAGQLGWRAATVVGFLKNQSKYAQAAKFAAIALGQSWSAASDDESTYWSAWIAFEGLGDRQKALLVLGTASSTESQRRATLRARLAGAIAAFPRG